MKITNYQDEKSYNYTYIHTHICIYMHAYMNIHTHKYTHIHIYTYKRKLYISCKKWILEYYLWIVLKSFILLQFILSVKIQFPQRIFFSFWSVSKNFS